MERGPSGPHIPGANLSMNQYGQLRSMNRPYRSRCHYYGRVTLRLFITNLMIYKQRNTQRDIITRFDLKETFQLIAARCVISGEEISCWYFRHCQINSSNSGQSVLFVIDYRELQNPNFPQFQKFQKKTSQQDISAINDNLNLMNLKITPPEIRILL